MPALPRPSESTGDFIVPEPGAYNVEFTDFEGPLESTKFPGSQSVKLEFEILDDEEFEGVKIKQYYGWSMHKSRSRLYPVVKAMMGRDIEDDEDVELDDLIGAKVVATLSVGERPDRNDPSKKFTFAQIDSIAPVRKKKQDARPATDSTRRPARRPASQPEPEFDETQADDEDWPESA